MLGLQHLQLVQLVEAQQVVAWVGVLQPPLGMRVLHWVAGTTKKTMGTRVT